MAWPLRLETAVRNHPARLLRSRNVPHLPLNLREAIALWTRLANCQTTWPLGPGRYPKIAMDRHGFSSYVPWSTHATRIVGHPTIINGHRIFVLALESNPPINGRAKKTPKRQKVGHLVQPIETSSGSSWKHPLPPG